MNQNDLSAPPPGVSELNELGQPVGFAVPNWKPVPRPGKQLMEGRLCRLEPLDVERHVQALWEANSLDREGRNWTYLYGPFASFDDYRSWMTKSVADTETEFYAIIDRQTGSAVGVASFLNIKENHGSIEVGHLAFSPLLQRKPQATEAMFLMMERAFLLGYRRYEWKCNSLNAPSRAAALRLGFTFEGIFRQAVINNGRNRDTAWFSITDREWPALRTAFLEWLQPANFDQSGIQRRRLPILIALARGCAAGVPEGDRASDIGGYFVSTDPLLLDLNTIHRLLSGSYWAADRPRALTQESFARSLCFGAYLDSNQSQIGFARVVTDQSTFSWICDVIVDESHRSKGVGKALMKAVMEHPDVRSTKCLLGTRDAHGLYERFGFVRREMMRREPPTP